MAEGGWYSTFVGQILDQGEALTDVAIHVHPTYENHVLVGDCWCEPRLEEGEPPMFKHRDKLDREGPLDPAG